MDVRLEFKAEVVEEVAAAQMAELNNQYDMEDPKFNSALLRRVKRALTEAVRVEDWSNCSRYSQFLELADIDSQVEELVDSIEVETGTTYLPVVDVEDNDSGVIIS